MISRTRSLPIVPGALLYDGASATVGACEWDPTGLCNVVVDAYNGVASAINTIGEAFATAGKWIGENVGAGAVWLWEHDPIMQLGYKIATGENVWKALMAVGAIIAEDLRIFGPYLAYIPGVGTAAAMAIAAGVALANGKSLTEIAIETMRGAIPPGPALTAFDTANALLHGKSITEAALEALHKEYPAAYTAVTAAVAIAQGGSITEAALSIVRDQLPESPPELRGAFDAGVSIAKGKRVQDALIDGIRASLPAGYQEAFDVAQAVANGKNLVAVAVDQAMRQLPAEARPYADVAISIVKGAKVTDVLISAARAAIPAEYVRYFDMAMNLENVDTAAVTAAVLAQIPKNTPAADVYAVAKRLQALPSATGATGVERYPHAAIIFGPSAPRAGASVGAAAIVNEALNIAIETLRAQLPSDPDVQAAFQIGVDIIRGKSIERVAMEVAKSYVPAEYQEAYATGAKVAEAAISGENLGDIGLETIMANLPESARPYADLAAQLVQSSKSFDAAITAARALLPEDVVAAFDGAMAIAAKGASYRAAAVDAVRTALTVGQDPGAAFNQAVSLAKAQIPTSFIDELRAKVVGSIEDASAALKAAFDQGVELAKSKAIQDIAMEVLKGYIPDEYKTTYQKVVNFTSGAPTSDTMLNVLRAQVPAAGQHVVDSATALFKGVAPENIASDTLVSSVVAHVTAYKRSIEGAIPKLPSAPPKRRLMNATPISRAAAPVGVVDRQSLRVATVGATPRDPSVTVVIAPSPEDFIVYEQSVNDIAQRRAALGAANPYTGEPLDPIFQAAINERVEELQAKPKSNGVLPLLLLAGGGAALYALAKRQKRASGVAAR